VSSAHHPAGSGDANGRDASEIQRIGWSRVLGPDPLQLQDKWQLSGTGHHDHCGSPSPPSDTTGAVPGSRSPTSATVTRSGGAPMTFTCIWARSWVAGGPVCAGAIASIEDPLGWTVLEETSEIELEEGK
jgi:hypothetical protein